MLVCSPNPPEGFACKLNLFFFFSFHDLVGLGFRGLDLSPVGELGFLFFFFFFFFPWRMILKKVKFYPSKIYEAVLTRRIDLHGNAFC